MDFRGPPRLSRFQVLHDNSNLELSEFKNDLQSPLRLNALSSY